MPPAPPPIRSTTDLAAFSPVVEAFLETTSDTRIIYEHWGSNDLYRMAVQDRAEDRAGADLVISFAVRHMNALVNEGCGATHSTVATLPAQMQWRDQLWGITRESAVMVYNRDLLAPQEVPRSRFDLLDLLRPSDSRLAGRVAT